MDYINTAAKARTHPVMTRLWVKYGVEKNYVAKAAGGQSF
jgi:hypothetical protein